MLCPFDSKPPVRSCFCPGMLNAMNRHRLASVIVQVNCVVLAAMLDRIFIPQTLFENRALIAIFDLHFVRR